MRRARGLPIVTCDITPHGGREYLRWPWYSTVPTPFDSMRGGKLVINTFAPFERWARMRTSSNHTPCVYRVVPCNGRWKMDVTVNRRFPVVWKKDELRRLYCP